LVWTGTVARGKPIFIGYINGKRCLRYPARLIHFIRTGKMPAYGFKRMCDEPMCVHPDHHAIVWGGGGKVPRVAYLKVIAAYEELQSMAEVGRRLGLTRERVRQILLQFGIRDIRKERK
jgi:hypothetical protein